MRTNEDLSAESLVALPARIQGLVDDGTLTVEQARAVVAALGPVSGGPGTAPRAPWMNRLAEVGGYLGAALVVAAGLVVLGQHWSDMTYAARVGALGAVTAVLVLAAVAMTAFRGAKEWDVLPNGETLRRLCGVLYTLAGGALFSTILVAMVDRPSRADETDFGIALIASGAAAFIVVAVGRWQAPTALEEVALLAATLAVYVGVMQLAAPDAVWAMQWTLLPIGLAWAIVGTYTTALRNRTLAAALGLTVAIFAAVNVTEYEWSDRFALLTLVGVCLAVYVNRPSWPYITAAVVGSVVLTVTWVGETMGAATALLAAGVVLLVMAGGALAFQRHRSSVSPSVSHSVSREV